jgi:UDP-N-acetylglucosamine 1-carboxyvinyltransferase
VLEVLCVTGGSALSGKVHVSGAKNAALPLLIATLLSREECRLSNVPDLDDIAVMLRLLRSLGGEAHYESHTVTARTLRVKGTEAPYGLVKALRASFWVLGPLLARAGQARVSLPGGDAIGSRPVDLHLKGLVRLGADIRLKHGVVIAEAPGGLSAGKITFDFPSVGATHHLLMTAALVPGETIIEGAAQEPEVVDLALLLSQMGAKIEGAGSSTIQVHGQSELGGAVHEVLGDRIEAATYLIAGAATQGHVTVGGISPVALAATLDVLEQAGCTVVREEKAVSVQGRGRLCPVSFATQPFPGVATDVQPLLMAALTRSSGTSEICENVFENRFGHVAEYRRFGADITVDGRVATVRGVPGLSAAPVEAGDIRAAAGEVIMGLMAEGTTQVSDIYHLDRGYDGLVEKLGSVGAQVSRIPSVEEKEVVLGC